jgi:hypothetical protein
MGAFDTAKEIVRIGSTAGLSKDVVDLLETKAALLAEQVAALQQDNAQLKREVSQLRDQLQRAEPSGFVESEGLLWKRKASGGFEPRPYCPQCRDHPVMMGFPPPPHSHFWVCPADHTFDYHIAAPTA